MTKVIQSVVHYIIYTGITKWHNKSARVPVPRLIQICFGDRHPYNS